jgi:hypothetical protein
VLLDERERGDVILYFFVFVFLNLKVFLAVRARSKSQSISDRFHWLDRTLAPVAH